MRSGAAWRGVTFRRLEAVSVTHSLVYLGLLVCAIALGDPQPATFVLGLAHGLLWIGMSLVCLAAARARVIPFWLAVTVAVIGGLGPFAGTAGFVIAQRRAARPGATAEATAGATAGTTAGATAGTAAGGAPAAPMNALE